MGWVYLGILKESATLRESPLNVNDFLLKYAIWKEESYELSFTGYTITKVWGSI